MFPIFYAQFLDVDVVVAYWAVQGLQFLIFEAVNWMHWKMSPSLLSLGPFETSHIHIFYMRSFWALI